MTTNASRATGEGAEREPVIGGAPGGTHQGPLAGITVVDLTRVLAGPYCTMVLRDLGARVIKVEQPGKGDDSRAFGPFLNGQSAYFASLNRGKESIALDLKADADRKIFDGLLAEADVLVENFRPGTMEKLGFGWDDLHARFPKLIYAAASGFGHTGPYARRAAYDMVVQAMGGIMSVTGTPGGPPVRVGTSIGDITAGLFTAIGVNAALFHRALTGEAMKVDVAMLDCQVAILENAIARYAATGEVAGPIGARHPAITPFAAFHAEDTWIVIAAGNDALFDKLAKVVGREHWLTDERFVTNQKRTEHWEALFEEINAALAKRPAAQWLAALEEAGVPAGPINRIDEVLADPHVRARNMVVESNDAEVGKLIMAGNPIKLSPFDDPLERTPAPRLDADRDAILKGLGPHGGSAGAHEVGAAAGGGGTMPAPVSPAPASSSLRYLDQFGRLFTRLTDFSSVVRGDESFEDKATTLIDALLSERGEVMGTAIAVDFVELICAATPTEKKLLFSLLAERYAPDPVRVNTAITRWQASGGDAALEALERAVESPRQELFRRTNMAPGGTQVLVNLRAELLRDLKDHPEWAGVDNDLRHLFGSWFNRGFLELRRIDWHTPASILEKLIAYEAVHSIDGWDDLRRRLASDRRCFGFFHPSLPDEPLIFVEVALVEEISERVEPIIRAPMPQQTRMGEAAPDADTAIFYSISNCQPGLRGIAFGNFLIKQVATDLARELPGLKTFATLSPIPGLRRHVESGATDLTRHVATSALDKARAESGKEDLAEAIAWLAETVETDGYESPAAQALRDVLLPVTAAYLVGETGEGSGTRGPKDPVARFHLGNGARVERVNWAGDLSSSGIKRSYGVMVNYLYDLSAIAANHEAFANGEPVARSRAVQDLLNQPSDGGILGAARDLIPIKRA